MAITEKEKREIETLIRKEIKDFVGTTTMKQYETKMIELLANEIKRGKITGDVKDIVIKLFREFYNVMWSQRSFWESKLKNA